MRRDVTWAVLAVAALGVAACGGDDDEGADVVATTPVAAEVGAGEVGAGSAPTAPTSIAAASAPAISAVAAGAEVVGDGDDGCTVTITGAIDASWSSDATGPQVLVVGDWLANPGPEDAGGFALNCYDEEFNIVGFTSSPIVDVPAQPATFPLSDEVDPPMSVDVAVLSDEGVWSATSGVLELVEFDDAHVRGTFSFDIADGFDATRVAHVEGNFSYGR